MSNVNFKLNSKGVKELLKSPGVQGACRDKAKKALSMCGAGYVVHDVNYPERAGAAIAATNRQAVNDNRKNNTLLKAVGG